jgi:hypothetical protein
MRSMRPATTPYGNPVLSNQAFAQSPTAEPTLTLLGLAVRLALSASSQAAARPADPRCTPAAARSQYQPGHPTAPLLQRHPAQHQPSGRPRRAPPRLHGRFRRPPPVLRQSVSGPAFAALSGLPPGSPGANHGARGSSRPAGAARRRAAAMTTSALSAAISITRTSSARSAPVRVPRIQAVDALHPELERALEWQHCTAALAQRKDSPVRPTRAIWLDAQLAGSENAVLEGQTPGFAPKSRWWAGPRYRITEGTKPPPTGALARDTLSPLRERADTNPRAPCPDALCALHG